MSRPRVNAQSIFHAPEPPESTKPTPCAVPPWPARTHPHSCCLSPPCMLTWVSRPPLRSALIGTGGAISGITTELLLDNNNISGPMPSELGAFNSQHGGTRDVAYFEGFGNKITGTIPTEFGYISASTAHLRWYQNSITGPLPTQLGQLSNAASSVDNLQVLLSDNSLCSDIPSEIAALTIGNAPSPP